MKKSPTAGGPWGSLLSGEMGDTPDLQDLFQRVISQCHHPAMFSRAE